jgi:hypothetical protein
MIDLRETLGIVELSSRRIVDVEVNVRKYLFESALQNDKRSLAELLNDHLLELSFLELI